MLIGFSVVQWRLKKMAPCELSAGRFCLFAFVFCQVNTSKHSSIANLWTSFIYMPGIQLEVMCIYCRYTTPIVSPFDVKIPPGKGHQDCHHRRWLGRIGLWPLDWAITKKSEGGIYTHRIHGNGIFTYICHKKSTKCRQLYHTWILWDIYIYHLERIDGAILMYWFIIAQKEIATLFWEWLAIYN